MTKRASIALQVLRSALSRNRASLLLLTAALVILFLLNARSDGALFTQDDSHWKYWLDPLISIVTLLIAGLVWWREADESWRESLPKRLTVLFACGQEDVMICQHAHLAGVADIRALGQQIGSQMSDTSRLEFDAPMVFTKCLGPKQLEKDAYYMVYEAKFELFAIPDTLRSSPLPKKWQRPL